MMSLHSPQNDPPDIEKTFAHPNRVRPKKKPSFITKPQRQVYELLQNLFKEGRKTESENVEQSEEQPESKTDAA